ncbi:uncharacterized protein BDCG_17910 [Blastomyces dermatitidis ER-3]|uniref:Uncharacterized protein n=2 Tax=Ajellomyces dermatitidis TaxID=5039 RepID=A0A0J9EPS9_AJEDA|nr:uncharacterized protein BDCG_17910 [Blastomyces dermatitidis ER-3]EQL29506.1 hypothetical protein BDFG_07877 [Blastomyces dermatitidis ATCC 26199]KMW68016.1 hypothetical protein BDDG_12522 [Blastomyces dermatitidis ATCC 18188]OAT03044.1 hypothetical protein BDCG_17910 [Blastomyces dermatitidis ER-3]
MVDQCSRSLACCEQSPAAFKCSSSPIDEQASPLNFSSTPSAAKNQESRADDWEDSDSNFDPKSDSHSGSHSLP